MAQIYGKPSPATRDRLYNFAMGTNAEIRRKRLKYQAWHRGIKEVDLVLGPFADAFVGEMDAQALDEFEQLLSVPDQELFDWLCERRTPPENYRTKIYEQVFDFSRRPRGI